MLAPMFRWWDPSLLSMVEPYLRRLLFGAPDEVCREFELWKWRRHYARRVKMPPEDAFHPMTRALGPIAAPAMAPLIASLARAGTTAGRPAAQSLLTSVMPPK
jgi:hypothetical protein